MTKTRVLIIDDSALVRSLLTEIVNREPDLEAIGADPDPLVAREMIRALSPDVLTLDIEMPRMDGLDFLERLMRLRPTPVVMVSTQTERGAEATLKALELGAVDFVSKPRLGIASGLQELASDICEKIRVASRVRPYRHVRPAAQADAGGASVKAVPASYSRISTEKLIAFGPYNLDTEAILEVVTR